MRQAIKEQLVNKMPDLAGRVFEPHTVEDSTTTPYLVICRGEEKRQVSWLGYERNFEIWPYVNKEASFGAVDSLVRQIRAALGGQQLTTEDGGSFTCYYQGSVGKDAVQQDKLLTRGLRFSVTAGEPLDQGVAGEDDPWVAVLMAWSRQILGDPWSIYSENWPLGYQKPAVLWRTQSWDIADINTSLYQLSKTYICHVLASSSPAEITGAGQIMEGLKQAVKLPLNPEAREYLTVTEIKGDFTKDAFQEGQITVTLTRKNKRTSPQGPLLQKIYSTGKFKGGG